MKKKTLREFRNDESGGILAFTLLMFMVMLVGGGMAVDFINYEYRREGVQDALDRGVLAAAALGRDANATSVEEIAAAEEAAIETVYAYIRSAGYDPEEIGIVVTPDFTFNSQIVAAISEFSVDTYFLRISGIDTLNGGANATAAVTRNDIEISLVVDISGSMEDSGKIGNLRTAATNFVTDMLDGDRSAYTTISLVPFSAQVRPSSALVNQFNYTPWQNYSDCIDFSLTDYESTNISRTAPLTQVQHFRQGTDRQGNPMKHCPGTENQIIPWSNSLSDLTTGITALKPLGWTAAYIGMKWGTALLDPDARPVLQGVLGSDSTFADRPADYTDAETLKFVILMTDGANTRNNYVRTSRYVTEQNCDRYGGNCQPARDYFTQADADYWNTRNARTSIAIDGPNGDIRLQKICSAADDAGIVVFTIGYDISVSTNPNSPYVQMRDCASTPGHFYRVGVDDLDAAFASIAQTIQKLKLTN